MTTTVAEWIIEWNEDLEENFVGQMCGYESLRSAETIWQFSRVRERVGERTRAEGMYNKDCRVARSKGDTRNLLPNVCLIKCFQLSLYSYSMGHEQHLFIKVWETSCFFCLLFNFYPWHRCGCNETSRLRKSYYVHQLVKLRFWFKFKKLYRE